MKHSDYWKERFARLEASGNRIGKNTFRQVEEMYAKAEKEITDKIELWYERLAKNNEISMTEARKLLSGRSLKEFRWSVEEYIEYGRKNAIDSAWMKELENASARAHISRLEAVKVDIQQSVEKLYGNQLDAIDAGVRKIYTDGYYRTAFEIQKGFGVGFEMAAIGEGALSKVINKPWAPDGMNFSDRIWRNKKKLLNELHGSLTRNILTGAAPDTAIRELAERMHVSRTAAGRLIMTESAFFQSAAQRDCFNDLNVERYEIVATLDSRTSDICQGMDKKVFDMKDFQPGVTAPPFHVYCRSTTAPHFDDWEEFGIQLSRAARDEDGKTYSVPGDMTYPEWQKSFVDGQTEDLKPVVPDDIIEGKPQTLAEKIQKVKEDIAANGGVITEDHIKAAGKAVQDDLVASRAGFKKDFDDATAAYNNSDIKKQIDELDARRTELHKKYYDAPYGSDERKKFYNEWEQAKADYWKVYSSDEAISFRSRISDAKKKYEGTWETNADELTEKLGQFRTMGIGSHDLKKEHYSGRGTLRDIVTTAYSHYPADWVEASIKKGTLKISKVSRGFYDGRTIAIDGLSESSQISTAFHELGHRFEDAVKGIYEAEDVFYKRRTAGCPLEWLGAGYSRSERTRKDDFLHSYMGKEYPDNFYELVSMGFDWAYTDPTRLWADEDFAQFIYGILSLK